MKSLLCMGVCLSVGLTASAKTIYVATDGNDTTGDGSFETPYLTPSNGIAHASTDDVVFLKNGTYEIQKPLALSKKITLRGESRENAIIRNTKTDGADYSAYRVVTITVAGARVESLTLCDGICKGAQGKAAYAGGNISMTAAGVVSNCVVRSGRSGVCTGSPTSNKYGGGNIYVSAGLITHCVVSNGAFSAQYIGCGGGIAIAGKDVTIDTCLITGNGTGQRGSEMVKGWGGGIYVYNVTGVKILNSTITGNAALLGGGIYCENKNTVVKNCIIAGNTTPTTDESIGAPNWHFLTSSTASVDDWAANVSSCLWGNDRSCGAIGEGSFVASPGFTDAANADYTLGVGSRAIGQGVTYEGIPVDLNGTPRKDPPDIGCYQSDHVAPLSCSITIEPEKAFMGTEFTFSGTVENEKDGATYDYYWTLVDRDGNRHPLDEASASFVRRIDAVAEYDVYLNVTNHADASDFAEAKSNKKLFAAPFTNYVTSVTGGTPVFPYGTPETAAATLSAALGATIPGSVVVLDAGTHWIGGTITLPDSIEIHGAGRETTILRASGTGYRLFTLNNANAMLEGLTIAGASYSDYGAAVRIEQDGGQVINCALIGNAQSGVNREGCAIWASSASAVVDRCVICCNTNKCTNTSGFAKGTVYMTAGVLRNTLISRNYLTDTGHVQSGRIVMLSGSATMENCTVVDNEDYGKAGCAVSLESSAKAVNTVFSGNVTPNRAISGYLPNLARSGSSTVQTSVFVGSEAYGATSRVADDAGFVDAMNGDYHLKPTSKVCRNWGTPLDWMVGATDLDGNPRIFGKAPDIGCYECQTTPGLVIIFR